MEWLLSFIPWWIWVGLALAGVCVAWRLLGWQGAIAALTAFLAAFGYGKGRSDAARDLQAERDRRNAEAVKDRKGIDNDVAKMPDDDVRRGLDPWMRDGR